LFQGNGGDHALGEVFIGFVDGGDVADGEAVDQDRVGDVEAFDVVEFGVEFFCMLEDGAAFQVVKSEDQGGEGDDRHHTDLCFVGYLHATNIEYLMDRQAASTPAGHL